MQARHSGDVVGSRAVRWVHAAIVAAVIASGGVFTAAAQESGSTRSRSAEGTEEQLLENARLRARLTMTPCAEAPQLDCGTITVPVDYERPYGETVGIAVIRARALDPGQRIGILVANPGGPGISGVDFVLGGAPSPGFQRLRRHFDIVSFDPRGVKRTRAVRCSFEYPALPSIDDDAALAEFFDELGRRHAQACLDQNGPFVTHIGTNNAARDTDMIRRALGETQITYAAGSYGSELGATYASLFPRRVRAMMLDGGIAPEFHDFNIEAWSIYSQGFEIAFRRLDQLCRRDAGCRLQGTGAVAALDEVLARLESAPVTAPGGVVLTAGRVRSIIAALLGGERNWPLMVNALADAYAGDYTLFFRLLPVTASSNTVVYPIWCNDYGTRRPAADYLRADEAIGALHPRFFGRFFVAQSVALCAAWPEAEPPVIRNVANQMATPILLVGNDFDPNTPLIDARRLARALGMENSLIRYEGSGHTAYFIGSPCIDSTIETYLVERRLPPAGFSCPALPVTFGASGSRAAASAKDGAVHIETGMWSAAPVLVP